MLEELGIGEYVTRHILLLTVVRALFYRESARGRARNRSGGRAYRRVVVNG